MAILRLENPIQNYDWGCSDKIPELFGIPNPDNLPLAEIWMGGHPKSPSTIYFNNQSIPLNKLLKSNPEFLGKASIKKFGHRLPFLFKVISAARPLSIQAHPGKEQAIEGFSTEDRLDIPVTAFNRNYKDDNHKPELLYALTPFTAMNGFRPVEEIISLLSKIDIPELAKPLLQLKESGSDQGLKVFYESIMCLPEGARQSILNRILEYSQGINDAPWPTVKQLHQFHPDDIGVLSPLLLNVVTLKPGEAMFLKAGTLHSYLEGTGLEIMACSDNVLRGGLTSKHIDIPELLKTIKFEPVSGSEILLNATIPHNGETVFYTGVDDFLFSAINPEQVIEPIQVKSAEILICIEGRQTIESEDGSHVVLNPGESCFICANCHSYSINGAGSLARAKAIVD